MVEKYCDGRVPARQPDRFDTPAFWSAYESALTSFRFDEAIRTVERYVTSVNQAIDTEAPFKKAKEGIDVSPFMYQIAEALRQIGLALLPIVPNAAEKILTQLSIDVAAARLPEGCKWGGLEPGTKVSKDEILFPRLSA